jgi:hypothetical protein
MRTRIDEIAAGIFRISTAVPPETMPGGFTFNQYLIRDEQPLLYHTGPKKMFALVKEAIDKILPANTLRYVGFSHYEADECGSLNEFLKLAPSAEPLCGPHGWECGHLFETSTATLFCGDLFTQGGHEHEPISNDDLLGRSEEMRKALDYYSATAHGRQLASKLAATDPKLLACMHGSAWAGDGAQLLRELGEALAN